MKYKLFVFICSIIIMSVVFSGCTNSVKTVNNSVKLEQPPKYQVPKKIKPKKPRSKGSLYANRGGSLFSDRKNLQIGDIVYVNINEGTSGDGRTAETATTFTQRQLENNRDTGMAPQITSSSSLSIVGAIASGINDILGLGIQFGDATSNFDTEAETTMEDIFTNDISAVVAQEFQNGNYFIVGEKNIVIKGQKITIELSGVMNPENLDASSTIESDKLANLKTMVYRTGSEADLEEKPWGTKILDTITPF